MTAKEVHNKLWILEYTSKVNQLFYQQLVSFFGILDGLVRTVMVILAIVSTVLSFVAISTAPIAVISLAAIVLVEVVGLSWLRSYFGELHSRWTQLLRRCEDLYSRIPGPKAKSIDSRYMEHFQELQDEKLRIDESEKLRFGFMWLHRTCQRQVNRQTYSVDKGTYEEVMATLPAKAAS